MTRVSGLVSAFLDPGPEDDSGQADLAIFCPAWIDREFGGDVPNSDHRRP
jgi:hypothetical protein